MYSNATHFHNLRYIMDHSVLIVEKEIKEKNTLHVREKKKANISRKKKRKKLLIRCISYAFEE